MNEDQMFDYLVDSGIATSEEIQLVTNINGWRTDVLEAILYARTGYRCFSQLED